MSGADPTSSDPTKPYAGFEGEVNTIFSTSTPHWPERPEAPEGTPNIIVMLADDLGFADLGCYGSEIDTPALDQLASDGVRYSNFHVNPMCSPTRASLLTGLNHHMAGMGHVAHFDPGFPGYAMELRDNAVTMGDVLQQHGYASLMVGKWHLCKDSDLNEAGSRRSWPLQKGFERFYGILDGFTNFHQPHRLYQDNHAIDVEQYDDDYYFTDDLTDQALKMIKGVRAANPNKPWFLYFAHGAVHAPLQARAADIEKYRDVYNAGWDEVRRQRYERQLELGVIPPGTALPERNSEKGHAVKAWDELTEVEKQTFARYQEVFAGMVDNVDQNFARLRDELEAMGEWDNTIVVFTSDNGGSREGQEDGTSAYFRTLLMQARKSELEDVVLDHSRLDLLGGPQTLAHYNMGWAMVSSAPFRMYKINTHQGGHQVPFIVSWPKGLAARGEIRRQYQHISDLLPTLAEVVGFEIPTTKHGDPLPEPAGSSFAASLTDAEADSTHTEQYYEMIGHRAYYREGWSAVTLRQPRTSFSEEDWELHNLAEDPTETNNLAAEHPEKVAELVQAFDDAAWANQVYPLDEGNNVKNIQRPPTDAVYKEPAVFYPGSPTPERWRCLSLISFCTFDIAISLNYAAGDQGMLVAHGDQGGGYCFYVEDGRLHYVHNGYGSMTEVDCGPIAAGASEIRAVFVPQDDFSWTMTVSVDGAAVAEEAGLVMLMAMAPFEGIDVGIDKRSPVSWAVYERHGPFRYSGELHSVTYTPGETAAFAGSNWLDMLREAGVQYE
jgi:arylsulfatase